MGSASVGAQCPLTSSLGEFLGYRVIGSGILGFRPCWCPSPFPSPSMSRCFLFTLLPLPLDFIRLFFFTVAVSSPHHQPSSLFQTCDFFFLFSSLPTAIRRRSGSHKTPFFLCFGRFTSLGSFRIFFSFRSSLTLSVQICHVRVSWSLARR